MAVPPAAVRRFLARARRSFWSASWTADASAPSASSPPQDTNKKKAPSGSAPHRLAAVMDAVNQRKLPPELRGRGNAVRSAVSTPYESRFMLQQYNTWPKDLILLCNFIL